MKRRRKESGFALLIVFLMAACVAIMLYMEMPRVAFEAERQKELLLIDRGNQFKRAIQVFVTDKQNNPTGRYPASIDQLENFNNRRYLRHKYVDPMTGKDEWRLIHNGGVAGLFPDSVTMSQNQQAKASGPAGSDYINVLQSFDAPSNQGQQGGGVSAAMRRRPSDTPGAPGSLDSGASTAAGSQGSNGDAGGTGDGGSGAPPATLPAGLPGAGQPGRGATGAGGAASQTPCTTYIGTCAPTTTGTAPQAGVGGGVLPGQAGNPGNGQNGVIGMPGGGPPGAQNGLNNGQQTGIQMNSAAQGMLNNLLTSPRPNGMPTGNAGTIVGGGIAGVASKFESEGIMVVNQRTAINEWEYIFDSTKYRPPVNPLGGGPGTPANATQNPGGGTNGPNGTNGPGVGPAVNPIMGPGRGQ